MIELAKERETLVYWFFQFMKLFSLLNAILDHCSTYSLSIKVTHVRHANIYAWPYPSFITLLLVISLLLTGAALPKVYASRDEDSFWKVQQKKSNAVRTGLNP